MWSRGNGQTSQTTTAAAPGGGEILYEKIQALSPQNDLQSSLKSQALSIAIDLGKTRWLMLQQSTSSVSIPLLVALVFWLTVIFGSFGLLAPRNLTVVATLAVCAISVSAAILLVFDMYTPFGGLLPFRTRHCVVRSSILVNNTQPKGWESIRRICNTTHLMRR
jgi:hypothetical protein